MYRRQIGAPTPHGDIHTDTYSLQNSRATRPGADIHRNPDTDTHVPRGRCAQIRTGTHRHLGRHRCTPANRHTLVATEARGRPRRTDPQTQSFPSCLGKARGVWEAAQLEGLRPQARVLAHAPPCLETPPRLGVPAPSPVLVPGLRTILEAAFRRGSDAGSPCSFSWGC